MAKKSKKSKQTFGSRKNSQKPSSAIGESSHQNLLQQALRLHQNGRLEEAEVLYRQILAANHDHPEALYYYGMLAHQVGRSDIACTLLRQAIQLSPGNFQVHNALGIVLNDQGKLDEAIASYRRALVLQPDHPEVHFNLGNTLKEQGKPDEAVKCYRTALSYKNDYAEAFNNIGIILNDKGRTTEARKSFRQAVALQPSYAEAHYNLGNILSLEGELDKAVASYRQALASRPAYPEALFNMANIFNDQSRFEEAIDIYQKLLSLCPGYVDAYINIGSALKSQGKLTAAVDSLTQALNLKPESPELHYNLGVIYRELGRLDDAIACYRKALSLKNDYAAAFKDLSTLVTFSEVDEVVRGMAGLYESREPVPVEDRIALGFALGKVFEDLGEYEKAFTYILKANRLKRGTFDYSIRNEREAFQKIKQTFSADFFRSRQSYGYSDKTPIFILGMPRSGTTLVEQILASHPLVFGAGELDFLAKISTKICPVDTASDFPEGLLDLDADTFRSMGAEYIEKLRSYSKDAQHISDKMPYNFLYIGLIRVMLPNAKIIHCRRDPMDNGLSIFKNYFKEMNGYAYDMVEIGEYFKLYLDLMQHWEDVLPGFVFSLNYEEMVVDQRQQTKQLLEYCDLPWNDACIAFHKTERKVQTASLAQVRKPIYKDSVELWKRYGTDLEPLRKELSG